MGIHARHRPAARPALIDLQRLLVLRTIVERGLPVERLAGGRQRHRRKHRSGDGVDPIGGNDVSGKRVAHDDAVDGPGRQRVVDGHQLAGGVARLREIAGALGRRRQRQHVVARAALLVVVGAEPEERLVFDDRTADRTCPVVVVLRRILQPRPLRKKQRPRRRTRLADEQRAAVPRIRPRAGRGVEDAARRVPHVGLVGLGLHLQLFHRLHRRRDGRAIGQVGDRHAFNQVAVAAPRAAAERQLRRAGLILIAHELRIAGLNHARRRDGREERVAAEDRQVLQGLLVERRRLRRAGALDERRFAGDGHLLGDGADLEREIQHGRLLRADSEAFAFFGLESGKRDADGVGARQHARKRVLADFVRHRRSLGVRVFVDERHFGAGDHALCIPHRAAQRPLIGLRADVGRADKRAHHTGDARPQTDVAPRHVGFSLPAITANAEGLGDHAREQAACPCREESRGRAK